jgi:uncharacterized membrane-anchored protein
MKDDRPWPVLLLTALGAWLAAVPLIFVLGLLMGDLMSRGTGPYLIGPLVLAGAVTVLRRRDAPLFVEQLAVPALLVGGGALAFGLFRDLHMPIGATLLAVVALALAAVLPRAWLRALLGAAAAALVVLACLPERVTFERHVTLALGIAWHVAFAAWVLSCVLTPRLRRAAVAQAVEPVAAGWLLATLAGLATWSGLTFLVGASLGSGFAGEVVREVGRLPASRYGIIVLQAVSVLLAAAAAARAAVAAPQLRRPWCAGVAAMLLVLAGFMPALGAVLLAIALCLADGRPRLAAAGAFAAAWIVGAFYYALAWPLATKAAVLVAAGAWLAAMARWGWPRAPHAAPAEAAPVASRGVAAGFALAALATLVVANIGIWQKQRLIADGQPVYIELAPVDPRSLMQGDYMRLNFRVPSENRLEGILGAGRPRVVARRDARGIATLVRMDAGTPLAVNELVIELTPKNGRWTVVTDAWFFREGEAGRWAHARYGEFRVDREGRALLVGTARPRARSAVTDRAPRAISRRGCASSRPC